jgi:multicomponent Na+:H+ antiporter subunit E
MLGLWLLLSGHFEPLMVALGLASTAMVVWLVSRMRALQAKPEKGVPLQVVARFLWYVPWLLWEVFVANLVLARIVLFGRPAMDPGLIHFRAPQRTDLARFIYANSITLTPGTITVDVRGSDLTIHALVRSAVDGIEQGEMVARIAPLDVR